MKNPDRRSVSKANFCFIGYHLTSPEGWNCESVDMFMYQPKGYAGSFTIMFDGSDSVVILSLDGAGLLHPVISAINGVIVLETCGSKLGHVRLDNSILNSEPATLDALVTAKLV